MLLSHPIVLLASLLIGLALGGKKIRSKLSRFKSISDIVPTIWPPISIFQQSLNSVSISRSASRSDHKFSSFISFRIPTVLIFLAILSLSFQSVRGDALSEECSMYLYDDNHLVCNEVYHGRYAAECANGFYYNESSGLCVAEDSSFTCPTDIDEKHMCILANGDTSLSLGCRSAWHGTNCDELYKVHIPDKLFRGKVCENASNSDPLCDISKFEMATLTVNFLALAERISSFEGVQYLINDYFFAGRDTDITSVNNLASMRHLTTLYIHQETEQASINIYDLNSLIKLSRLYNFSIYTNERVFDISVMFRNIGIFHIYTSNTSYTFGRIPLCRFESDGDYWNLLRIIFPIHNIVSASSQQQFFLANSCPLMAGNNSCSGHSDCPSIILNEVYNSVDSINQKQCAFIAKEGTSGECYTVHDDYIRSYLTLYCSCSLTSGIITVATMRSALSCTDSSLSLSDVTSTLTVSLDAITTLQGLEYATSLTFLDVSGYDLSGDTNPNADLTSGIITVATMRSALSCTDSSLSLSDVTSTLTVSLDAITTLQGLEYATSLTFLDVSGYDLSGDTNPNAEYDKLVVQILAKAVAYSNAFGSINSGLTSLYASGCGLSEVSDVLDLTPIADGDILTKKFKLTSLDISNNNISDVSVLITSDLFSSAVLTTLDISNNSICDIEGMVSELSTYFGAGLGSITYSDQTCHCTASVSSSDHQVCREVYPDRWAVECWNGYYLDKASGECLEVCASGYELDSPTGTPPYSCTTAASDVDDSIRLQVCERHSNMKPVLEVGATSITCGCRVAWYGDDCYQLYQVYIPDELFREKVCDYAGYDITLDPLLYPDRWAVEWWNGYYLDKASGECLEVCASGYELDSPTGTPPYSCTTAASDVDDSIRLQVCERHSNMKPVLEVGATSITCGCRVAWYGDDCDQLYQVYIPDELFREKVCDYAGYDITLDPLCDVSEFEMAGINGSFYSYGYHITSFEGAQYLINIYLFSGSNTDVTSIYPISFLEQLSFLSFNQTSSTYDANIYDFNSLFTLNRLNGLYIYGNEQIYDISVSYRNVGLSKMYIAHTSHSAFIPLCRSEDDTDYWTFITTIFPIHSSDYKDTIYIPNSCPLNSDPGNSPYNCDTSNASCPSIVLNEVYNSVDGVNAKQCAFIAKEGTSGECYTVHDDYIRSYLTLYCSCSLTSGIITVATMRSALSCTDSSLSLSDVTSTLTVSLDAITTLQGLEYAT
ncbi:hypothetical protein ADUPG1_012470, partial [Aduncisulcus paluster]